MSLERRACRSVRQTFTILKALVSADPRMRIGSAVELRHMLADIKRSATSTDTHLGHQVSIVAKGAAGTRARESQGA